jgi:hypothetical protein
MPHLRVIAAMLVLPVAAVSACGDDAVTPTTPDAGAPVEAGTPIDPVNDARQTGRIVRARSEGQPLGGAIITVGERTAIANEDGTYEIGVPKGLPYTMKVTAEDHFAWIEQEWTLSADTLDRGDTQLIPNSLANLLAGFLPGRDTAKGMIGVRVLPLPPCESEEGSEVSIEPAGSSEVRYFASGLPRADATAAVKDESMSAIFYNVDVGVPVRVTVTSPRCEAVAYPVDHHDVTYTGNVQAEAGDSVSFVRVFLGPEKPQDAGTD